MQIEGKPNSVVQTHRIIATPRFDNNTETEAIDIYR